MNEISQSQAEYKQQQQIQSFYEPALCLLSEIYEHKKECLRAKGYDQNNAAVAKTELSQLMSRRLRLATYYADQIITSLIKSKTIESFGCYVRPVTGITHPNMGEV